jgi:hypothetical protein
MANNKKSAQRISQLMAWRYGGAAIGINNGIWRNASGSAGAGIWQRKEKLMASARKKAA